MKIEKPERIARIDNAFILNAQYRMTAKEQKILYFLISQLNPKNDKEFTTVTIPIKEIEETLNSDGVKWGSLYEEINRICESMISKSISFPSSFLLEGKPLKGYINWFQSILPMVNEFNQTCIEFSFSPKMKPFLLQLNQYVRIGVLEVAQMQNAHAIRMFSIFKSEKDRAFNDKSIVLKYDITELKAVLGIADKYNSGDLKDFRNRVLNKIRDEINENSETMFVTYDYIKKSRKVTGVAFTIHDKVKNAKGIAPAPLKEKKSIKNTERCAQDKIDALPRAKLNAYEMLVKFGVYTNIALDEIIPTIKGSEFVGYEDIFVQHALAYFLDNTDSTPEHKAATFVTWWKTHKVFEKGEIWSVILEAVVKYKKQIEKTNPVAFENRMIAMGMSNVEFEEKARR